MPSPLIIIAMLSLVVSIVVIVRVHRAHAEDVRTLKKPLWYLVAFVPVLGAIAWAWLGRPERGPSGKRVAKDRSGRGTRHKISTDRQIVVDRLTSDIRTRPPRSLNGSADSPRSPGSLTERAARSASSAADRSAASPVTAAADQE
ncbi:MAG: hypothetical protein ACOH16_15140 [Propionibacteriaceae bacterium]